MTELPQPPTTGASLSTWAEWAADVGRTTRAFKVFPCNPYRGDERDAKRPRFKGWQGSASWDRKTVAATWDEFPTSNIGLAIQPGFVALDLDVYKPGHEELLATFEAEYGTLPQTLELASANGGFHLIYQTGRLLGNSTGDLPGFGDVRGYGGYVVGPGSKLGDKTYAVAELVEPVALPMHVDARITAKASTAAADRDPPPGVMLDDPLNIARFTAWLLSDAKVSVSGMGGNNTLAATAAMGASYALTQEQTCHLLVEHWNQCDPPWEPSEIEHHGGSGYRSSTSRFGNMASTNPKALGFEAVARPRAEAGALFQTMADIAGPAPPRRWAAGDDDDGWVPLGGVSLLYGAGGVGKTALMGQWALAQARGEKLFGTITMRQMPVVLIAAEDDAGEIHRRFEAQGRRSDDQVSFAAVRGMDTAMHPSFRERGPKEDTWLFSQIDHKLGAMPEGDKLLILDNIGQMYRGNPYESSEVIGFLNDYLGRLATKHAATIVLLGHPSETQRQSGDGGSGSVAWSAGVRARLYFERHMSKPATKADKPHPIGEERVLSRKKSNYAKDGAAIIVDWDNWKFIPVSQTREEKAAALFKPVPKPSAQPSAVEHKIVSEATLAILASNPSRSWSGRALAADTAHYLASQGHEGVTIDAIRATHQRRMIENACPAYRRDEKGVWRHATIN